MWYKPLLGGVTVPWSSRLIRTHWCSALGKQLQKGPLWKMRGQLCFKGTVRTKMSIGYRTFKVNASKTTQREYDGKSFKQNCWTLPLCLLCVVFWSINFGGPVYLHYKVSQRLIIFPKMFVCVCRKKESHIHLKWHEGKQMMREFSFWGGVSLNLVLFQICMTFFFLCRTENRYIWKNFYTKISCTNKKIK